MNKVKTLANSKKSINDKEICEYPKEMAQPENIADVEAPKNWNETL